ncbi:UNVERIFIED_CONTAM: hypothetical protein FKN15_056305 [Acipenser sinensis]
MCQRDLNTGEVCDYPEKGALLGKFTKPFTLVSYSTKGAALFWRHWGWKSMPTFCYFTWHTCVLGIVGCGIMMFLINPIYASASIAFMLFLLVIIHHLSPTSSWGYISQALIFHQSRYVSWLTLVDKLNIKAFVNLTLADTIRHGVQQLLFISGLDRSSLDNVNDPFSLLPPWSSDSMTTVNPRTSWGSLRAARWTPAFPVEEPRLNFPALRRTAGRKVLSMEDYMAVVSDSVKMLKNVALARYFSGFDRKEVLGRKAVYVDVWPLNLMRLDSINYINNKQPVPAAAGLRAHHGAGLAPGLAAPLPVRGVHSVQGPEEKLWQLLRELRIKADIHTVAWDSMVALHWHKQAGRKPEEEMELEEDFVNSFPSNATRISDDYLQAINRMILQQGSETAVRFLYLPRPPADTSLYHTYLCHLDIMTKDLGPTQLIHGVTPVTSTHL